MVLGYSEQGKTRERESGQFPFQDEILMRDGSLLLDFARSTKKKSRDFWDSSLYSYLCDCLLAATLRVTEEQPIEIM